MVKKTKAKGIEQGMKPRKLRRRFAQSIVDRAVEEAGGIIVTEQEIYGGTTAPPGSMRKIEVMRCRNNAGVKIFHPDDVKAGVIDFIHLFVNKSKAIKELLNEEE
jgi:hypothetical protein